MNGNGNGNGNGDAPGADIGSVGVGGQSIGIGDVPGADIPGPGVLGLDADAFNINLSAYTPSPEPTPSEAVSVNEGLTPNMFNPEEPSESRFLGLQYQAQIQQAEETATAFEAARTATIERGIRGIFKGLGYIPGVNLTLSLLLDAFTLVAGKSPSRALSELIGPTPTPGSIPSPSEGLTQANFSGDGPITESIQSSPVIQTSEGLIYNGSKTNGEFDLSKFFSLLGQEKTVPTYIETKKEDLSPIVGGALILGLLSVVR